MKKAELVDMATTLGLLEKTSHPPPPPSSSTTPRKTKKSTATAAAATSSDPPEPIEYKAIKLISVVQMGLNSAMNLGRENMARFSSIIESHVVPISRMLRSASLSLEVFLTSLARRGEPIPDLYRQKDTYWKKLLRFDPAYGTFPRDRSEEMDDDEEDDDSDDEEADDDDDEAPPTVVEEVEQGPGLLPFILDTFSAEGIRVDLIVNGDRVKLIIETPEDTRRKCLSFRHFDDHGVGADQVVNYAARAFGTAVINNAYLTVVPTLARLTQGFVQSVHKSLRRKSRFANGDVIGSSHVFSRIRAAAEPVYAEGDDWQPEIVAFISEVRQKLEMDGSRRLYDDYFKKSSTMTFGKAFKFNYWMLSRLNDLKLRGIKLSPIFAVSRTHIRLDRKVLTSVALEVFEGSPPDSVKGGLMAAVRSGARAISKKTLINPTKWLPARPRMGEKKPAKSKVDELEAWTARKKALDSKYDLEIEDMKREVKYVEMENKYVAYRKAQVDLISKLFSPTAIHSEKWTFDGTITTDNVKIGIQRSRDILVPKIAKKNDCVAEEKVKPVTNYEKEDFSSLVCLDLDGKKKKLFAGGDPGRKDMIAITFCLSKADRLLFPKAMVTKILERREADPPDLVRVREFEKRWHLSGSQYRTDSGILKLDARKKRRMMELETAWNEMAQTSSLKTVKPSSILQYLRLYSVIEERWWSLAMARIEAKDRFSRIIGKRKVLDAFFAKVDKELQEAFGKDVTVVLAYGSAGLKMKPNGVGEVSVPTTGTYKAALRIFGPERCVVQDEWGTTCMDWETMARKEAVYRMPSGPGDSNSKLLALGTTLSKKMPKVTPEHKLQVEAYYTARLEARKKRRRGLIPPGNGRLDEDDGGGGGTRRKKANYQLWYPEVRGLRYKPSTGKYCGRDYESAGCIARLAAYKFLNGPRKKPAPFCRKIEVDNDDDDVDEEIVA